MKLSSIQTQCTGVILAAGMGKRMKTSLPKVAHTILGRPMVVWSIEALREAGVSRIVVVLSPEQTAVKEIVEKYKKENKTISLEIAWQPEAKGTGHATQIGFDKAIEAFPALAKNLENQRIVVTFGDHPAVSGNTFKEYVTNHLEGSDDITVFAFEPTSAAGYGRVLFKKSGKFKAIREEKDCSVEEMNTKLCNSGFLCCKANVIRDLLPKVTNKNGSGEYYLTEVPELGLKLDMQVGVFRARDEYELVGVNSQNQLATLAAFLQDRLTKSLMENGVQILNPAQVYIEPTVKFESDVIVEPFVYLSGNAEFKKGTRIKSGERV